MNRTSLQLTKLDDFRLAEKITGLLRFPRQEYRTVDAVYAVNVLNPTPKTPHHCFFE